MQHIVFTVTNDLDYDQRMHRICSSLCNSGYIVTLVGREMPSSTPLTKQLFGQKRLRLFFSKGPGFYIEYNIRLFIFLLRLPSDCICAIDLDTVLPVYFAAKLTRRKKVYDAHEYFSQLKEVVERPFIHKIWKRIEAWAIPRFKSGYTVSNSIALEFKKLYKADYITIRNMPLRKQGELHKPAFGRTIIYQGAVNEARGFEYLIPAMKAVHGILEIYGDGNFLEQAKSLVQENHLTEKVVFKGKLLPGALDEATASSYIGINLVENTGLNQYFSLANKFFDYIQHAVPQVTMDFPEYRKLNEEYDVAILIDSLDPETIAASVNRLLDDAELHSRLQQNCVLAATVLNWQEEEKKLVTFYKNLFE